MNYLNIALKFFVLLLISYNLNASNYRVVDVHSNDSLNVRSNAAYKSDVVGALKYDAENIILTGEKIQKGKSLWVEIKYKDITGWVNSRYLSEQVVPTKSGTNVFIKNLNCNGSEPDWVLKFDVHKNIIEFESLSFSKQMFLSQSVKASKNNTNKWFVTAKAIKGKEKLNISIIETNQCSDDMSDFVYRYSMIINTIDNGVYSGCCNRKANQ
ncbi:hypothetical protein MNBD_GAMMA08-986 [hydrothermal vent metagenome]|uniref:SH3b domain-containing protein n=1 Tax=hydrothermal vent metagenome TaxID=652676 RepID=A0A3B0WTR4_9ZZZZ